MSYSTYHIYGYGAKISDITIADTSIDRLHSLIRMNENVADRVYQFTNKEIDDITFEDLEDYESNKSCIWGFLGVLVDVIDYDQQLYFEDCEDFDCNRYLLFTPSYPWQMTFTDVTITTDTVKTVLQKYISVLTDKPINIDYLECENGG